MRYLLDTNVLSELRRPEPSKRVVVWLLQNEAACGISELVIGEFVKGAYSLPDGKKRQAILAWISEVEDQFEGRMIALDRDVLKRWGELCGVCEREHGRRLQVLDNLIAASALSHGLVVVTRNIVDFPSEIDTFNPWG
ncbi:MAG: putative nucleic acid-binding protein [Verrucomicrobiales bacterium]|jgi:predicted nucleic acid-binding protein